MSEPMGEMERKNRRLAVILWIFLAVQTAAIFFILIYMRKIGRF